MQRRGKRLCQNAEIHGHPPASGNVVPENSSSTREDTLSDRLKEEVAGANRPVKRLMQQSLDVLFTLQRFTHEK